MYKFFATDDWSALYDENGALLTQGRGMDEHAARDLATARGMGLEIYTVSDEEYSAHFDGIGFPPLVAELEPHATIVAF